jgi:hypothetical protein
MKNRDRIGANGFARGTAWINLVAGLWLIASPWIYGYAGTTEAAAGNSVIAGIIIAAVAIYRLAAGGTELTWVNVILGAWVIASPWVYGYAAAPAHIANSLIVGIVVLVVALSGLPGERAGHYGSASSYPWGLGYPPVYPPWGAYGWGSGPWYGWPTPDTNFRGRGPRGYQRSDAQIRDAVCERMTDHPGLDASDVEVTVHADGIVTLQGTVSTREIKRLAEDIAYSVSGVRDVHNGLRVTTTSAGREMPRRAA